MTFIDDNDNNDYHCNVGTGMSCQACKVPPMVTCPNTPSPAHMYHRSIYVQRPLLYCEECGLVVSDIFWSKFLTCENLQLQTIHFPIFRFLICCTSPWCYVLWDSHHKFPPEPSASDNCHSSAFSGKRLPPVSHPQPWTFLHIAQFSQCTFNTQAPLLNHSPRYHCEPLQPCTSHPQLIREHCTL